MLGMGLGSQENDHTTQSISARQKCDFGRKVHGDTQAGTHIRGVHKQAHASGVVPLDFYLKAKRSSSGLNEKRPPQVTYVNTWSTPSGGDWGGAALLEEVHHWRGGVGGGED